MTIRSSTTVAACLFLTASLWGDCAPDYRTDKKSGMFIADFIVTGTLTFGSSELTAIRSKLIGACANEDSGEVEALVKSLFQDRGYFRVTVNNLDIKTIDPLAQPKRVTLEADVTEGPIYKLSEIRFTGNRAFAAPKLRSAFSLRKGDVCRRDKMASSFEGIRKLYTARGFGDLVFVPDTRFSSNATVILTLAIMEGPQYHMGKLRIFAKQETVEHLQEGWRLPEGSVFDFGYLDKYIHANQSSLPPGFTRDNLRIVRNCPAATIEVRLIIESTDPALHSLPGDVRCEEPRDSEN